MGHAQTATQRNHASTWGPAVVEAVSWADTVVYVTSVERAYAVEHMVEWVFCLDNAGIGLVECINKTRTAKTIAAVIEENQRTTHFPSMAKRLGLKSRPIRRSWGSGT